MKHLLIFFLAVCLAGIAAGQQLITDDSVQLKRGIYRDFYEFKYNKPSIKFLFTIGPPELPNRYPEISIGRIDARAIGYIYGFSNGREIYLALGEPPAPATGPHTQYGIVTYLSRYSLYGFVSSHAVAAGVGNGLFIPIPVGHSDEAAFVDMNTGQKQGLYRKWVEAKIQDDPEIYNRYLADKRSLENRIAYLVEYLEKHPEEIQVSKDELTSGDINEILLYKPSDPSPMEYCHRVMEELSGCKGIRLIEISESKYSNGNYKYIGLRAKHNYGFDPEILYRIGNWRYYSRDGELSKEYNFDLIGHDRSTYEHLILHY